MRGSATDCDPHYQKGAEFVKIGDFSSKQLIWYSKKQGYFVTARDGRTLNGETRLSTSYVSGQLEKSIAGK